jgi:SAM-dependent methyltransferase
MSLFYRILYRIGFTPWEHGATDGPAAEQIARLFEREERERQPPYGQALDLGCGSGIWSVILARRGWQVTGVDIVPKAVRRARDRASTAGVAARFVCGDVTALRSAGIEPGFQLILDFECFNRLSETQRRAVGREVTAVAAADATLLLLAWTPGRRWPLSPGASRRDVASAFPQWKVVDEEAYVVSALPAPLRKVQPCFYRLRRE